MNSNKFAQSDREHWNSRSHIKGDNKHEIDRMWQFFQSKITEQEEINMWKRLLEFGLGRTEVHGSRTLWIETISTLALEMVAQRLWQLASK